MPDVRHLFQRPLPADRAEISMHRLLLLLAALGTAVACGHPDPDFVWIPAEGFKAGLAISADTAEPPTGQWITLHAQRRTGPWRRVTRESLAEDACWVVEAPPDVEPDVAASVRWTVEPNVGVSFNLPDPANIHARSIRFERPGRYRLHATSHTWCSDPVESAVLLITAK
jgi:hypothetical protein